jgi:2''-5'' RNA ligase
MRLFIALNFSDELKDGLCKAMDVLRADCLRGNFTRRENLHLTLAFLGETAGTGPVVQAMNRVQAEAFPLDVAGFGTFSRDGGELCWVGVKRNQPLESLYDRLWAELAKAGFRPENRPFKPHLTLGRKVIFSPGFHAEAFEKSLLPMHMEVDHISLMKSERIAGRLVYTELYSRALGGLGKHEKGSGGNGW